jgi:hypothetical protein
MALVLHLGGVGKYVIQIQGWSIHSRESWDLHTLAATFIMWGNNVQKERKIKRENP